ncbi:MAG: glycosyl transferase [Herbaspirillum sp.]|jgi:4-amino-4-deoxy-L-arabinose transferase-like glycosyltransferase|nr:glycosyl transferase [Herbaspirillum sp.]
MSKAADITSTFSASPSRERLTSRTGWALLTLIAGAYLLPGIFGHGPWKQDETYSFGIIWHMIETGNYLVPTNAGTPFMEKPPLYYWTAAAFGMALKPWFGYVDGARVASVFFMLIAFVFVASSARLAWNEDGFLNRRVLGTLALFAGSAGMVKHAHDMFTDVALVAGAAMALYGLLRIAMNQQAGMPRISAALWLGLGVGIAQMSKGLFMPIIYAGAAFWAGILIRECRSRSYLRMVMIAVTAALPFFLIWPTLLAQYSMPLFMEWFWDNNVGRFLGFSVRHLGSENDTAVVMRALIGFALPGAPLALLAVAGGDWRHMQSPRVAIPLIVTVISLIVLEISATARQLYLLPLILPLCLLGGRAVDKLPDRAAAGWDWFSRIFFGALTLLVWIAFCTMLMPVEYRQWLAPLGAWLPLDFKMPPQPLALAGAGGISLGWLLALPYLTAAGKWRGAFSWFGGITVMWGVTFTLLLPWIDYAKSYEYSYSRLTAQLAAPAWRADDCMASIRLGESEAPMLQYYAGILHQPVAAASDTRCRWLIAPGASAAPAGWKLFWEDGRDGDHPAARRKVYLRLPPAAK